MPSTLCFPPRGCWAEAQPPHGVWGAVGIEVRTLGVSPTLGHAMALLWGVTRVPGMHGASSAGTGRCGRARWGCGGDAGSPSCRPGVSNEWYELPARPLIASSKSLNELLLLLRPLPLGLTAWPALPRCRMVLDAPHWAPMAMLEIPSEHPAPQLLHHPCGAESLDSASSTLWHRACSSAVWALLGDLET